MSPAGRFKDEGLELALTSGKAFTSLFLYRQQRNIKHDQKHILTKITTFLLMSASINLFCTYPECS